MIVSTKLNLDHYLKAFLTLGTEEANAIACCLASILREDANQMERLLKAESSKKE